MASGESQRQNYTTEDDIHSWQSGASITFVCTRAGDPTTTIPGAENALLTNCISAQTARTITVKDSVEGIDQVDQLANDFRITFVAGGPMNNRIFVQKVLNLRGDITIVDGQPLATEKIIDDHVNMNIDNMVWNYVRQGHQAVSTHIQAW